MKAKNPSLSKSLSVPSYLKGFSLAQLEVILGAEKVKQVVAAAGSGKTRTVIGLLEYRLRSNLEKPGRILLMSFSRKAVGELRERLPEDLRSSVEISTFHAFCLHHLRKIYPRALGTLHVLTDEKKEKFFYDFLRQPAYLNEIGGIPIPFLWEEEDTFAAYFPEIHSRAKEAYKAYKYREKLFEFEDLIQLMLHCLRNKNKKSHRVDKVRDAYDLIIVDEFQDTDPRQLEFLGLMKAERKVVVGDDWQAIYAFRGASLAPFLDFQKLFGAQVLRLCDNYRSLENVTNLGSRIIKASSKQIKKRVNAVRKTVLDLPVISLKLEVNESPFFAEEVLRQSHKEYRILVRTNRRRDFWLGMGFEEEQVMTIHKSKGLEFPIVFLDICGGWSGKAKTQSSPRRLWPSLLLWRKSKKNFSLAWDEEIRILYVGASRAMNLLFILHHPQEFSGERENFYCEKLILAQTRKCSVENLSAWLEKESQFRKAA